MMAQEKYKELKDGTTAKYVYYSCSKSKDRDCKNKYIREEELIEELIRLMDKIDMNQTGILMKFEEELKRYNKFHRSVLGTANTSRKW